MSRSHRDTSSDPKTTPPKRRSLFDLLDALKPRRYERKPRSSKEATFRRPEQVPPTAQDLAAREHLRRR